MAAAGTARVAQRAARVAVKVGGRNTVDTHPVDGGQVMRRV